MIQNGIKTNHLEHLSGLGSEMVQNGGLGPKIVQRGKTDHLEHLSSLGPEVVHNSPQKAVRSIWAALGPK